MITYKVLIDWNRDGLYCRDVIPGDALNTVPTPATMAFTPAKKIIGSETLTTAWQDTAYGRRVVTCNTNGATFGGCSFGYDPDTVVCNRIPVLTNQQYTAAVWVRRTAGGATDKMVFGIRDQDGAGLYIAGNVSAPLNVWTQFTQTFTTLSTSTHVEVILQRDSPYTAITFEATGLTFVTGTSVSAVYNTGAITDAYEDVTNYVRDMIQFQYGMTEYPQEFAPPARAMIVLHNADGIFTPGNTSSPLYGHLKRGTLCRIEATTGAVTRTLFEGTISKYQIGTGINEIVTILIEDAMLQLLDAEYAPPLLTSVRTDEVLTAFFDAACVPYPYPTDAIMLDVTAAGALDMNFLYENRLTDFDQGATTIAYAGDNAGSELGISAQGFLRDCVAAEFGGRFFWDARASQFIFHSRHHDALNVDVPVSLSDSDILHTPPPVYVFADDIANDIEVTYSPRRVDSSNRTLYTLENPRSVRTGMTEVITVRYQDPDNDRAQVGALSVDQPTPGVDWSANTAQDGSGTDVTASTVLALNPSATSAEVAVQNTTGNTIYLTALTLHGKGIYTLPRESARARDAASIAAHGVHKRVIDVPIIDSSDTAQSFADYAVLMSKDASERVASLSFEMSTDDTLADQVAALEVGSPVLITMAALSVNDMAHVVIGVRHTINASTNSHMMTLMLAPAARTKFGILDDVTRGVIDSTMHIGV